jgi:hypothetical protein
MSEQGGKSIRLIAMVLAVAVGGQAQTSRGTVTGTVLGVGVPGATFYKRAFSVSWGRLLHTSCSGGYPALPSRSKRPSCEVTSILALRSWDYTERLGL